MIDLSIRRNLYSLYLLQSGNYIVPLLTLPWLTRNLGIDAFGQFGFITAFVAYFVLLVDWGFSLSATKQIAINHHNKLARSKIFWKIFSARFCLCILGLVIFSLCLLAIPSIRHQAEFFYVAYLAVLGSVFSPSFYYQGVERMGKMALMNSIVKLSSIPCIFLLVTDSTDLALAIGIQSGFIFLAGMVNFVTLVLSDEIVWTKPTLDQIWGSLKDGWPLFLSTASISLYSNTNIVILGFITSSAAVAYFTTAQTVIRAGQGLYGPISQAIFPRMSHLFHQSKDSAFSFLRQLMFIQGIVTAAMSLLLFLGAPWLVTLFFGNQFEPAALVLRCLSPLLFLVGLSNVFGIQGMVPLGHTRTFSNILLASGLLNIAMIIPLGFWFNAVGGAISLLITELVVTILMGFHLQSVAPKLFKIRF
jgi:PST family polysaccharide transporter